MGHVPRATDLEPSLCRRKSYSLAGLTLAWALVPLGCSPGQGGAPPREIAVAGYVSDRLCMGCHVEEAGGWRASHHDLAMQEATGQTVLADFEGVRFDDGKLRALFLRDGDDFVCRTEGPDGKEHDFPVRYTFGVEPLQQYLIAFPGGRLQCFTIAWDTENERWFSLYPEDDFDPGDPLHWTGRQQNWNSMCADCHSTHLEKNYDPTTDSYATTWAALDVGCQACHGPGEEHLAWVAAAASGENASPSSSFGLRKRLARGQPEQVQTCAACHSLRVRLAEKIDREGEFHDSYMPELLRPGSYHADGQIDGEVYVYGSFVQSKMHARGVVCSDCHDPHSLKPQAQGNALCLQCHSPNAPLERFETLTQKNYDSPEHHFHANGSSGSRCIECHMPTKTYMVVDPRHDHSLRVPRPDLSVEFGTPNACNGCHSDRDAGWAAKQVETWYGPREELAYDDVLAGARRNPFDAREALVTLAADANQPPITRATALELVGHLLPFGLDAKLDALADPAPDVRVAALVGLERLAPEERLAHVLPLVSDPVRAVRIQAARSLADLYPEGVPEHERKAVEDALLEFERAQAFSADQAPAHLNLGILQHALADPEGSLESYKKALELDPWFLPARFNLATLLSLMGKGKEAVDVLLAGVALSPQEPELHYSLGLALAEVQRFEEAADSLGRAADMRPEDARKQYNAGLALQRIERRKEAEVRLLKAHAQTPDDPSIVHALAVLFSQMQDWDRAQLYALELRAQLPENKQVGALLRHIETKIAERAAKIHRGKSKPLLKAE